MPERYRDISFNEYLSAVCPELFKMRYRGRFYEALKKARGDDTLFICYPRGCGRMTRWGMDIPDKKSRRTITWFDEWIDAAIEKYFNNIYGTIDISKEPIYRFNVLFSQLKPEITEENLKKIHTKFKDIPLDKGRSKKYRIK